MADDSMISQSCHVDMVLQLFQGGWPFEEYKPVVLLQQKAERLRLFSPLCTPCLTSRRRAPPPVRSTKVIRRRAMLLTSTRTSLPGSHLLLTSRSYLGDSLFFPFYRIKNPLAGIPKAQLLSNVEQFAKERGMSDISDLLKKGALVAQDPASFEKITELDEDEKTALRREVTHKWSQPRMLYLTIILCSIGAAVQYVRYLILSFGFHR